MSDVGHYSTPYPDQPTRCQQSSARDLKFTFILSLSLNSVKFSSCLFVVCLRTSLYCFPLATVLRLKASIQGALCSTMQLYMSSTME